MNHHQGRGEFRGKTSSVDPVQGVDAVSREQAKGEPRPTMREGGSRKTDDGGPAKPRHSPEIAGGLNRHSGSLQAGQPLRPTSGAALRRGKKSLGRPSTDEFRSPALESLGGRNTPPEERRLSRAPDGERSGWSPFLFPTEGPNGLARRLTKHDLAESGDHGGPSIALGWENREASDDAAKFPEWQERPRNRIEVGTCPGTKQGKFALR